MKKRIEKNGLIAFEIKRNHLCVNKTAGFAVLKPADAVDLANWILEKCSSQTAANQKQLF